MEKEKSRRLEGNTKDDTSPWLGFMQWQDTFRGKDPLVRISFRINTDDLFFLGDWIDPSFACQECPSPSSHETNQRRAAADRQQGHGQTPDMGSEYSGEDEEKLKYLAYMAQKLSF